MISSQARCLGHLSLAALLLSAPLAEAGTSNALSALEGQTVTVMVDLPANKSGLELSPDAAYRLDFGKYMRRLDRFGVAIAAGDEVVISKIRVKKKHVEIHLGKGGHAGDIAPPRAEETDRGYAEQNLTNRLESTDVGSRENDSAREDLVKEEQRRRRDDADRHSRAMAEWNRDNVRLRKVALTWGSRIYLRFSERIPKASITPERLRRELVDVLRLPARHSSTGPAGEPSEQGLRDLLARFVTAESESSRRALTLELRPTPTDYASVFRGRLEAKAMAHYSSIWNAGFIVAPPRSGTEVVIHPATTDELLAWDAPTAERFRPGYKALARYLKPNLRFHDVTFAGSSGSELRLDGLVFVNGAWRIFPKPFRAFAAPDLWTAAANGSQPSLVELLEDGEDPEEDYLGVSPFFAAAMNGHPGCAVALIAAGVDPKSTGGFGETALHWATVNGKGDTVTALIALGLDPNARSQSDETPLFLAALRGHRGSIEALLAGGADITLTDLNGRTALDAALRAGHIAAARSLVLAGGEASRGRAD